jgi:hypothetical protein
VTAALTFLAVFWFVYDAIAPQLSAATDRRRAGLRVRRSSWLACRLFAGAPPS